MTAAATTHTFGPRALRLSLAPLALFTLIALAGYGIFGLAPERIPSSSPLLVRFYQVSFQLLAQAHIVVALATLVVMLVRVARTRWVPAFLVVGLLAFTSEWMGTGYGIPFGAYSYTGLLGYRIGGRVPWSIPASWFLMALPCYLIATHVLGRSRRTLRLLAAATLLTLWDLALDPAMSHLTPYWTWADSGSYYGMPWVNVFGWMLTGLVLMVALEVLRAHEWGGPLPLPWLAGLYGLVLLMPLGMLALAGVWGAVLVTCVALGAFVLMLLTLRAPVTAPRPQVAS